MSKQNNPLSETNQENANPKKSKSKRGEQKKFRQDVHKAWIAFWLARDPEQWSFEFLFWFERHGHKLKRNRKPKT